MSLIIHGELDAISGDAAGLQAVSDKQAAAMQRMASTLEAAASALQTTSPADARPSWLK